MQSTEQAIVVETAKVACDGGGGALGHPMVYMTFAGKAEIVCPYCSRRYRLAEGAKAEHAH
ncbi:MAG: zinc-finger domain-containing protein [Alphaproteobacteria bacterium]|nr:zinc-finger domain-containing protein [Alphaproteobacteria bacterium]